MASFCVAMNGDLVSLFRFPLCSHFLVISCALSVVSLLNYGYDWFSSILVLSIFCCFSIVIAGTNSCNQSLYLSLSLYIYIYIYSSNPCIAPVTQFSMLVLFLLLLSWQSDRLVSYLRSLVVINSNQFSNLVILWNFFPNLSLYNIFLICKLCLGFSPPSEL